MQMFCWGLIRPPSHLNLNRLIIPNLKKPAAILLVTVSVGILFRAFLAPSNHPQSVGLPKNNHQLVEGMYEIASVVLIASSILHSVPSTRNLLDLLTTAVTTEKNLSPFSLTRFLLLTLVIAVPAHRPPDRAPSVTSVKRAFSIRLAVKRCNKLVTNRVELLRRLSVTLN